jgi:GTP cyclohydrolase FolE2
VNPSILTSAPSAVPDVQAEHDERGVTIDRVGIRGLRYPILLRSAEGAQQSVASWELTVELEARHRGTHMSRFVETLEDWHGESMDGPRLLEMLADLRNRLEASRAEARCDLTLFLHRPAPISGLAARYAIDCRFELSSSEQSPQLTLGVRVPVTTLCPCSKEISEYGAHNQRGYVDISATVVPGTQIAFEDLIDIAESSASAPIHPLLKRVDERHVTMQAYDAPTFVEDVVRTATLALVDDPRVIRFTIEAENHESIHDHAAVATVHWERG